MLSDNRNFPSFMRTVPSDENTAKAIVKLLRAFHWTYVSAVYDDSLYSVHGYNQFECEAKIAGICIAIKEQFKIETKNDTETLERLLTIEQARGLCPV